MKRLISSKLVIISPLEVFFIRVNHRDHCSVGRLIGNYFVIYTPVSFRRIIFFSCVFSRRFIRFTLFLVQITLHGRGGGQEGRSPYAGEDRFGNKVNLMLLNC